MSFDGDGRLVSLRSNLRMWRHVLGGEKGGNGYAYRVLVVVVHVADYASFGRIDLFIGLICHDREVLVCVLMKWLVDKGAGEVCEAKSGTSYASQKPRLVLLAYGRLMPR